MFTIITYILIISLIITIGVLMRSILKDLKVQRNKKEVYKVLDLYIKSNYEGLTHEEIDFLADYFTKWEFDKYEKHMEDTHDPKKEG